MAEAYINRNSFDWHPGYSCDPCNTRFEDERDYLEHAVMCHPTHTDYSALFTCKRCKTEFCSSEELDTHKADKCGCRKA